MRKIRKNLFMALSFAMAISAIGVATSLNFTSETAAANTVVSLYVKEGASIRKDVTTDENGNVVVGSGTGIRYTAVASADLVQSLVETTDGVTTYKEGAKLGMFIVPKKAIDKYEAQKDAEGGESDYFKYFSSVNSAITEDVISYVCEAKDLDATTEYEYKVAIVDIETENYTEDYQAVAYYVLNGKYYYSAKGDVRSVAYVADKALLSTEGDNDTNDKTALGNIIEKYIALSNGEEGKYEKNVATLASFDLKETYAAPINATDLTYTVAENETDVSINGTKLTGLSTDGAADVQITAYDGYVDFTLKVTTKAEKGETKTMYQNEYLTQTYTAYGATTGEVEAKNKFTGNPALNNVVLGAGVLSEGSTVTSMGTTNLSYLKIENVAGTAGTNEKTFDGGSYVTILEFTGNNMPMVGYYVERDDDKFENVVQQKGVLLTNGFNVDGDTANLTTFKNRITVFGYQMLTEDLTTAGGTDPNTNEHNGIISTSTASAYYNGKTDTASYTALANAGDNVRYRMFIQLADRGSSAGLGVRVSLHKINDDGTNGDLVFAYNQNRGYGLTDEAAYYNGSIVLYGRPGESTKIDKIHYISNSKSTYVTVGTGVGSGWIPSFNTLPTA